MFHYTLDCLKKYQIQSQDMIEKSVSSSTETPTVPPHGTLELFLQQRRLLLCTQRTEIAQKVKELQHQKTSVISQKVNLTLNNNNFVRRLRS